MAIQNAYLQGVYEALQSVTRSRRSFCRQSRKSSKVWSPSSLLILSMRRPA